MNPKQILSIENPHSQIPRISVLLLVPTLIFVQARYIAIKVKETNKTQNSYYKIYKQNQ